jgi:nicotinic acid mononucleotide adenylyltransferase
MIKEIIEKIHDSDLYGYFIEIGAGLPVSSKLMEIAGSSKTVSRSFSPYSKDVQYHEYSNENIRSVSFKNIKRIVDYSYRLNNQFSENFIFVSSWQLETDKRKVSHGWIGCSYKGVERYYHITLSHKGRKEQIDEIGRIGILLIDANLEGKIPHIPYSGIDIIKDEHGVDLLSETIDCLYESNNGLLLINEHGDLCRAEEEFRKNSSITIFKGSFNPPHKTHVSIIEETMDNYPESGFYICISLDTYSKGRIEKESLMKRLKYLKMLNYKVLITCDGYFANNVLLIQNRMHIPINFLVGIDTLNRLLDITSIDEFKSMCFNADVCFYYSERKDIKPNEKVKTVAKYLKRTHSEVHDTSSTHIRTSADIEQIKDLIPSQILEEYIKDER